MKWLEEFIKKYPDIQEDYDQQVLEGILYEKDELKKKVPEHRWWEIDDIDAMDLNLPEVEQDRLRNSSLYYKILNLIDSKGIKSPEIKEILDDLEDVAFSLDEKEKGAMEVLLIEGLINATYSDSRKIYDEFYEILGPELKKMCDSNNAFWMKLGEENKKEREARYKKMVEQKQQEDAAKQADNGK